MYYANLIKLLVFAILFFHVQFSWAAAPTYYVSPTGAATWANCEDAAGTPGPKSGAAACSLATANTNAAAGDIVNLRAGTYSYTVALSRGINPTNSGSAGNLITFQNYTGEEPLLQGTPGTNIYGFTLGGAYVKITGIKFADFDLPNYITGDHNEVSYCTIYNTTDKEGNTLLVTNRYGGTQTHNWIHHNTFYRSGATGCNEGNGDFIKLGEAGITGCVVNNNTVEDNVIYHAGHTLTDDFGCYNVWRNNIGHNEGWKANPGGCTYTPDAAGNNPGNGKYGHRTFAMYYGDDGVCTAKTYKLFEGNRAGYASINPNNNGADGLTLSAPGNIIRYNSFFGADGPGIYLKNGACASDNRIYNNTLYKNGQFTGSGDPTARLTGIAATLNNTGNVIKNNLFYDNGGGDWDCSGTGCAMSDQTWANNWCTAENCGSVGNGNPVFVNPNITDMSSTTLPNLELASTSSAINVGSYLTQVNDADGCDADTADCSDMVVDDALYFQDGTWGSSLSTIAPDEICISASADATDLARCRAISSINYATNTITLASEITFANNEYIWLYKKSDGTQVLIGTKPDIGAHEYNSGSVYTLTVSKLGSGTGTVTSDVTGIDCGATCTYDYDGTVVTLTATATLPNYFSGWSGTGGCTGASTCQLTMSEARAATATFSRYGTATIGAGGSMTIGSGGSLTLQ